MKNKRNNLYAQTFRRGLFDFHAGEAVPEVEMDISAYFTAAAKAGIQTITFMTKDAFGNSYFDTKTGHKNRRLQGDLLADATAEAKKHGIDIIAYYNVGLNSHVAKENPDYRQRTADGQPVTEAFDYYDILCMNSPYRDYVYGQLAEIARNYEVAGFFFDISYVWEGSCHCEYCQRWYRARFGRAMPVSPQPGTEELRQWKTFQREIRHHFLRDAVSQLKSINPAYLIGWNHAGDPKFGQVEADEHADYFTSEFHPPHYMYGSLLARWKRSFDKPFELMMPSEMGSWGEWTVAPAATLKTTAAIAVANGGSISFGHVVYPSGVLKGQIPKAVTDTIGEANDLVRELEPWLLEAKSMPMVAVLHSIENQRMLEASALAGSPDAAHLQGIHRILIEGHIHFDIIDEHKLMEAVHLYEVLIVPDQAYLSEAVEAGIREYVRNGGCVLASGRTSLYGQEGIQRPNFGLSDLFGVDFIDFSVYSTSYLYPIEESIKQNLPDLPILLKEQGQRRLNVIASPQAACLSGSMNPAVEAKVHRHVYHQHAHPANEAPYPAVVTNAFGRGKSLYIAGPIEASYWQTGSPWLRNLYLNCLRKLNQEPRLVVKAPLSVEVNVMVQARTQDQASRIIVHLINVREDKAAGSKSFIEEVAPVDNVEVRIQASAKRVYLIPSGTELSFTQEKDSIRFTVPRVDIHTAVVIDK
ncbi:beta-galactosidase trimerization domain-containing protein [Paenibacillus eucommiae]|uniref:Beta-galactosidase trimerisation domain-containing protein n=1 Tax=Paenibacillus eucommiae TaxID=1355755 RepID=A0ABS4J5I4_9BACL|nr:beta-galactosidase trimerization domain-containing protein [Paenibacillus eucommiae]MBP1994516.1 hypothetical protein [Paenibacillus eucommiae]